MLQASRCVNILSCRSNMAIVATIFLNEDYQYMYNIFFSPRRQVKVTYNPQQFTHLWNCEDNFFSVDINIT